MSQNNNHKGVTFAFAHKDKVWRTRYSFTPTAYATVDNNVVSCNSKWPGNESDASSKLWRHDVNDIRNNFYGFQYDMSVAFVSNYNPSSTKIYKSLSVETNSSLWNGHVSTNIHPAGSNNSKEYQFGRIRGFERKEGIIYADMPRSEVNSTANIAYSFSIPDSIVSYMPTEPAGDLGLGQDNLDLIWTVPVGKIGERVRSGKGVLAVFDVDTYGRSYLTPSGFVSVTGIGYSGALELNAAEVQSYNPSNGEVTMKMTLPLTILQAYPFEWMSEPYISNNAVWTATSSKLDGDTMRGQYAYVFMNNNSTQPVEALAFNLEYEPTKLDHSLGQNA